MAEVAPAIARLQRTAFEYGFYLLLLALVILFSVISNSF